MQRVALNLTLWTSTQNQQFHIIRHLRMDVRFTFHVAFVLVMFVSAYSNPIPVAARGRNKSRAKATSVLSSLGSNAPVDTSHVTSQIQQSQQSPHVLVPMKPEVPLEMSPSSSSVNKDLQEQVVQTRNSTIQQSSSTVNQNQDPAQQEVPSVETHEGNSPPATQVSSDNLSDQGDPEVVSTSLESSPEFSIPDMNEMAEKIATPYSQEGGFDEGLPLQATVSQTLFPANPIILQQKILQCLMGLVMRLFAMLKELGSKLLAKFDI